MEISNYWVGSVPARPMVIDVRDANGSDAAVLSYTTYKVRLFDPENREIDLGNAVLEKMPFEQSKFVFVWPTNRNLFYKPGDYMLQMELTAPGRRDFTSTHVLRVRELGKEYR